MGIRHRPATLNTQNNVVVRQLGRLPLAPGVDQRPPHELGVRQAARARLEVSRRGLPRGRGGGAEGAGVLPEPRQVELLAPGDQGDGDRRADAAALVAQQVVRAGGPVGVSLIRTVGTTDRPASNGVSRGLGSVSSMRTGRRCTILTKLPVAFSGGNRAVADPVAGVKPATRP
jgi:hypothetical protein